MAKESFTGTEDYKGKEITIKQTFLVEKIIKGHCVEVNESGITISNIKRGKVIFDMIPWNECKRIRYMEKVSPKES